MKKLFIAILMLCMCLYAKSQYGDQIDTTIAGVRGLLHVPSTYSKSSNKYAIIFQNPGAGEHSIIDIKNLYIAHFFYTGTWNGTAFNYKTNTTDSFIVFSLAEAITGDPVNYPHFQSLVAAFLATNRVDINALFLTGFSRGGQLTTWYPAHISGAFPQTYYTPVYKLAAVYVMAAESNPSDHLDYILTDTVAFWGIGDPNDHTNHGAATIANVNYLNSLKANYAVLTKHDCDHNTICKDTNFYSPSFHQTINGINMNPYEWMLYNKRSSIVLPPPVNTIATGIISGSPFCVSKTKTANVIINFTVSGNYNNGNVFTAQLSDENGSFANALTLGTVTRTTSGYISGVIPANLKASSKRRIRVISNNPAITGGDNGNDLSTVFASNSVAPATAQNITVGANGTLLTVSEASLPLKREWLINGISSGITTNTFMPKFGSTGNFIVACKSYFTCDTITSNAVTFTVTAPVANNKIILTKRADNTILFDGCSTPYKPGDTLVIDANFNPYSRILIKCANNVTVINANGQVKDSSFANGAISGSIEFQNCNHVHFTGTGDARYKYGFLFTTPDNRGFAVQVYDRSSNIELDHFEAYKKSAGVVVKEEQQCVDSLSFPNWVIHDIDIHDNYIHNMLNEGMYIGSTAPNSLDTSVNNQHPKVYCLNSTVVPAGTAGATLSTHYSMRLGNIHIHNNILDSTGRGGIQLASADSGYNEIDNNRITRSGYSGTYGQGNNIVIGGYTHADIHDNYCRMSVAAGIFSLGSGLVRIYNNDLDSSGILDNGMNIAQANSILVDTRNTTNPSPGHSNPERTTFMIRDNKTGKKTDAFNVRVYKTYDTYNSDNLICTSGTYNVAAGINYNTSCGIDTVCYNLKKYKDSVTYKPKRIAQTHDSIIYIGRDTTFWRHVKGHPGLSRIRKVPSAKIITLYDTLTVIDTIHIPVPYDSLICIPKDQTSDLGIFYFSNGAVDISKQIDTAHLLGVNSLRTNITRSGTSTYHVGEINAGNLNAVLVVNNSSDGAAGFQSYLDSLFAIAKPKWLIIRNEPTQNVTSIAAFLTDVQAGINVAHANGVKVAAGGLTPDYMFSLINYLKTHGSVTQGDSIRGVLSLNMSSGDALTAIARNDSMINALAAMNVDAIDIHAYEPLLSDTAQTTLTNLLPIVVSNVRLRTGNKAIISTETGTYNHSCSLLTAFISQWLSLRPLLVTYFDGVGNGGNAVKLQDCFKETVNALQ